MKNIKIERETHYGRTLKVEFVGSYADALSYIDSFRHDFTSNRVRKYAGETMLLTPAGSGPTRLVFGPCDEGSIEEYLSNKAARGERQKEEAAAARQMEIERRQQELDEECRGWYVVELAVLVPDYFRGHWKTRYTNWRILANSQREAYNLSVAAAYDKLPVIYDILTTDTDANITYVGAWTDELEMEYAQ